MGFWWVNQSQTYDEERVGGYLWSPKWARDGSRRAFYDAMTDVEVDDLVVHYVSKPKGMIRSLSMVTASAVEARQPSELRHTEMWGDEGWRVEVRHVDRIRPIERDTAIGIGPSESPFTRTGSVQQGYLYRLTPTYGAALLDLLDPLTDDREGVDPVDDPLVPAGARTVALERGTRLEFDQVVTPGRRAATRAEWKLVEAFVEASGVAPVRRQYVLADGISIYCDLYVADPGVIVEAKADASRTAVREAIGQLHDYEHKEPSSVRKVLLVPESPAPDLLNLLRQLNIGVLWPDGSAWEEATADFASWSASSAGN